MTAKQRRKEQIAERERPPIELFRRMEERDRCRRFGEDLGSGFLITVIAIIVILVSFYCGRAEGSEINHKKNTAFRLFFAMVDSAAPADLKTGLSPADHCWYVDGTGTPATLAVTDTAYELGNGLYGLDFTAAELNHDWVGCVFDATGAADTAYLIRLHSQTWGDCTTDSDLPTNFGDLSITASTGRVDVASIEGSDATDQINAECDAAFATWDPPTQAELDARTLVAASYFDPATDTVANVTTVATLTGHTAQTGDTYAALPSNFSDLDIDANGRVDIYQIEGVDASTEIRNKADEALVLNHLDHLLQVSDDDSYADNSIVSKLVSSTGDWTTFVPADDSLQAISESGGGGPTAAQIADAVWDETVTGHDDAGKAGAQLWTDIDAILVDTGTTLDTAIADVPTVAEFDARTLVAASYFDAATDTVTVGVINTNVITAAALSSTASDEIADEVWDELRTGHVGAGSFGEGVFVEGVNAGAIVSTSYDTGAITATAIATDAIGSDELAASAKDEIVDQVWDEESTGHVGGTQAGQQLWSNIDSILTDTNDIDGLIADIGSNGSGLTALPWNAAWDAEVQSEANDALVAIKLDHLVAVADADDPVNDSIIAHLASSSGDWSTFNDGTDSLEAISDNCTGGGGADASDITYTPAVATNWNTGDPGNADDAFDELAANVNPLLPTPAPVLDNISWTSAEGTSGKNTWNVANPISGYEEAADAGSVNNSGDALDVTMGTSGNEHGVMDYDSPGTAEGVLNDDVAASDNWPADCFGPGGSDGGGTNTIYLKRNDVVLHSVNLLTFESGNSYNGNGSGFTSLSDDTPVYFAGGSPTFPPRTYRTGSWKVVAADMVKGYNVITIDHETAGGTETTNVQEYILDDEDTATSYSSESFSNYASGASTKHLSGVEYHNGTITATYNCTFDNAYRNTFKDGTAVTHPTDTNCSISDTSLADSAGDEAKQVVLSPTATVDATRIIGGNLVVNTRVDRTVQTDATSSGATQSQCLVDRDTQVNGNEAHYYADETLRIKSNEDFNTDITVTWDETESLVDSGTAGYNNGIQVTEDRLYYPGKATVDDYSSLTSGPAGNPDYSTGVTGTRYYFGQFYNATGRSNFSFNIQGSATLVDEGTLTTDTNEVSIAIRLPTQTGWMCINQDYVANQWGSTSESATYPADVGCYAEVYGSDKTIPTSAIGWTVGTKTTDDSYDQVYYRVSVPQGWTGYIESITVNWGAS